MEEQPTKIYSFNTLSILDFLINWRKPLIAVMSIALIASAVFSSPWFIKPKYKSTVVFFASNTASISRDLLNTEGVSKHDFMEFGEEDAADQLVQILQSESIRDSIVRKFNLMSHYDIDKESPLKNYYLNTEYEKNISFRRTEYMSVEIKVLDTDRDTAALIANEIARLLDQTKTQITRANANKALQIIEFQYKAKQTFVDSMNAQMRQLRAKGIFDYATQIDNLNQAEVKAENDLAVNSARLDGLRDAGIPKSDTAVVFTKARIVGAEKSLKQIRETLKQLEMYGGDYTSLEEQLKHETEELTKIRLNYEKALIDAKENLDVKFVVNYAKPAEKKSYPVRWLIVVITMIGTFVFSLFFLVLYENYLVLKKKKQQSA